MTIAAQCLSGLTRYQIDGLLRDDAQQSVASLLTEGPPYTDGWRDIDVAEVLTWNLFTSQELEALPVAERQALEAIVREELQCEWDARLADIGGREVRHSVAAREWAMNQEGGLC